MKADGQAVDYVNFERIIENELKKAANKAAFLKDNDLDVEYIRVEFDEIDDDYY